MRADEGKSYDSSEEDESIKPVALRCHSLGVLAFFVDGMEPLRKIIRRNEYVC